MSLEIARAHLAAADRISIPEPIRPSQAWLDVLHARHYPLMSSAQSPVEIIHSVTSAPGYFSFAVPVTSRYFDMVRESVLQWHEQPGRELSSLPPSVSETPLAFPESLFEVDGRLASTAFLWFLRCAMRITARTGPVGVALELGSGHGGLARVFRLLSPGSRYVLLDMPASLSFAEVYLRETMPDAKIHYLQPGETWRDAPAETDYLLVPTCHIDALDGMPVDVVVNTLSLSEMTGAAYAYFLDFVQNRIAARFFYNINRYGMHEDGLLIENRVQPFCGHDIVYNSFAVDPHWDLVFWSLGPDGDNVAMANPLYPNCLEILLKRTPEAERDPETCRRLSAETESAARRRFRADREFHRLMWISIAKHPNESNLELYATVLTRMKWREANHFIDMLNRLFGRNLPTFEVGHPPVSEFVHFF